MSAGDEIPPSPDSEPEPPATPAGDTRPVPGSRRHAGHSPFAHGDVHGPQRRFVSAADDQLDRQEYRVGSHPPQPPPAAEPYHDVWHSRAPAPDPAARSAAPWRLAFSVAVILLAILVFVVILG